MYITKTDFIEYLKCPKCLWLKKRRPDLYVPEVPSDFEESKIEEGYEVELLARSLFKEGHPVEGNPDRAAVETRKLVEESKFPIFQATGIADKHYLARVDILDYDADSGCWDIYEVKSSTQVKTDREHNHIKDVTFQKFVLEKLGLKVGRQFIAHLNKTYRKAGDLNVRDLFTIADVSTEVARASDDTAIEAQEALALLMKSEIDLSSCSCLYLTRRNHCSSFAVFNPSIPAYSVHDISRIRPKKIKALIDSSVVNISDVSEDFALTENQRAQVDLAKSGKAHVNREAIKRSINDLAYPLYFLDYETYSVAIPILDGYSPYQHIPFQVSIHKLDADETLTHYEYLGDSIDDVPCMLIEYIKRVNCTSGTIISWHASFENTRNKEMADLYPQYSSLLLNLNARTFDLETVFKKDYLHPGFRGRTSIKNVLPVLIPQFSYGDLDIGSGTEAMEKWRRLIFNDLDEAESQRIKHALLQYCAMDTLAMVEIYKHLQSCLM